MRSVTSLLLSAILWLAAAGAAGAASGDWNRNDHVEMRLISAVSGVGELKKISAGLHFRMKPGWKLYWRTPGDAGFPPLANWSASENVSKVDIQWPAPKRFSIFELETLGYEDEVILPLNAAVTKPGEPVKFAAKVDYLTCKDICIPYSATATLSVGGGEAAASEFAFEIDKYRARVPGDGARHGLRIQDLQVAFVGDAIELKIVASSIERFRAPDVYLEGPEGSYFGKPVVDLSEDGMTAVLEVGGGGFEEPVTASGVPITVTLVDGERMLEERLIGKPSGLGQATAPTSDEHSFLVIVLFALAGGLIFESNALRFAGALAEAAQCCWPWRARSGARAPWIYRLGRRDCFFFSADRRWFDCRSIGRGRDRLGDTVPTADLFGCDDTDPDALRL